MSKILILLALTGLLSTHWAEEGTEKNAFLDFANSFTKRTEEATAGIDARATFKFTANRAVDLAVIKTSCGCAVPILTKFNFIPGEGGEIFVVVSYGSIDGLKRESVSLRATSVEEHSTEEVYTLTVETLVPKVLTILPGNPVWGKDESDRRVFRVESVDERLKITQISLSDNFFVLDAVKIFSEGRLAHFTLAPSQATEEEEGHRKISILRVNLTNTTGESRTHSIILLKKDI